ncbi:HAD hydrolase-like protein [Rhodoluna sp.]|uniref:HAD hydrolase-like protein n=1 Tax=Rhodoluna sp. TaxID=1969481 RepID=UPI0025CF995D|nr:HAD hydrolase-like protein [Rhodoluna sp.]
MNYTTVLWDLDGTILDSAPGVFASFVHTFETLGLPVPPAEQMRTFLGPPLEVTFGETLGYDAEVAAKCLATYREIYLNGGQAVNANIFDGVLDVIAASKAAGLPNSLATSKGISGVNIVGEHFDFLDLFDVLGAADLEKGRSTKSAVVEYALAELAAQGADLSRTVLIGDRIHDIEGAREHGIEVILVKWGYGDESEWAQADAVAETADELRELLGL